MTTVAEQHTPVQRHGDIWLKRDDLYTYAGVYGGKVRSCRALCEDAIGRGYRGVVTAGSRHSPQVEIVAHVGKAMGLPVRCHVPAGPSTPQIESAEAQGATILRHRPGHNSVIVRRAKDDAVAQGWYEIPFGMECDQAVWATAAEVDNLPVGGTGDMLTGPLRIVVPVGSGMTLAGITWGFDRTPYAEHLPILGVCVGADPAKRLKRYAHPFAMRDVELVHSTLPYHEHVEGKVHGVQLDPVYEAKCLPYLRPGDLLWIVGRRLHA